jgi:hypothetical protein
MIFFFLTEPFLLCSVTFFVYSIIIIKTQFPTLAKVNGNDNTSTGNDNTSCVFIVPKLGRLVVCSYYSSFLSATLVCQTYFRLVKVTAQGKFNLSVKLYYHLSSICEHFYIVPLLYQIPFYI